MTQEEKQLLLIDLCGRLPYGVKVSNINAIHNGLDLPPFTIDISDYETSNPLIIINSWYLPWLRPMSSMTEEEKKVVCSMNMISDTELNDRLNYQRMYAQNYTIEAFDYFNEHHLDYRGLIPMGLALKAPEGMYKTE